MKAFVQVNLKNEAWDNIPIKTVEFEDPLGAATWSKIAADILNCKIRVTYPSPTWNEEREELSSQEYAGKLSGHYFEPPLR